MQDIALLLCFFSFSIVGFLPFSAAVSASLRSSSLKSLLNSGVSKFPVPQIVLWITSANDLSLIHHAWEFNLTKGFHCLILENHSLPCSANHKIQVQNEVLRMNQWSSGLLQILGYPFPTVIIIKAFSSTGINCKLPWFSSLTSEAALWMFYLVKD